MQASDPAFGYHVNRVAAVLNGLNPIPLIIGKLTIQNGLIVSAGGAAITGNSTITGNLNVTGNIITSGSSAPASSALGAHVVSAVVVGNNMRGQITITADATGIGMWMKICTVTFNAINAHAIAPRILVGNSSSGSQSATTNGSDYGVANETAGGFDLWLTNGPNSITAIPASATATVDYWCIE
jgi:hypothetical protein